MITTSRGLLACSLLAVLGGCVSTQCADPPKLSCADPTMPSNDPPITCNYQFQVIAKDSSTNSIKGKVPDVLVIEGEDEHDGYKIAERKEFLTPKSTKSGNVYTLRVSHFKELSNLIEIGQTYEFFRVGNYPEFGLGKQIVPKQIKQ